MIQGQVYANLTQMLNSLKESEAELNKEIIIKNLEDVVEMLNKQYGIYK